MNTQRITVLGAFLALLFVTATDLQAQMSIGVRGGSTGAGGEFTYSINDNFNVRLSGSAFSYTYSGTEDLDPTVGYDVDGAITSLGLTADYFPFKKFLKLSVGVHYHDFEINGFVAPTEAYEVEGKVFSPEKLGTLTAVVNYENKIVPYAGIGFGNPVGKGFPVRLTLDIGAFYTKAPQIDMVGQGMIAPTANQGQDFEDGLSDFKFYPVINLGLSFRFLN